MLEKARILYIDDEESSLYTFKRSFRKEYEIFTALSTEEGDAILKENEIHIVLTDQRMPEGTGTEFLATVAQRYPDIVRLLITGYTDIITVIDSINNGHIYKYIAKPYQREELQSVIDNAYQKYYYAALFKEEFRKYKQIFTSSIDPIFIINSNWEIVEANNAFWYLFKFNQGESLFFSDLLGTKDIDAFMSLVSENKDENRLVILKDQENNLIECMISIVKISINDRGSIGYQSIVKDVRTYRKESKLLTNKLISSHEEQRKKVSEQLLENVAQQLAAIKMQIGSILNHNKTLDQHSSNILTLSSNILNGTMDELRTISFELVPSSFLFTGLTDTLFELAASFRKKDVFCEITVEEGIPEIQKESEIIIFRIVEELIYYFNKFKKGKRIHVSIKFENPVLAINIECEENMDENLSFKNDQIIYSKLHGLSDGLKISSSGKLSSYTVSLPINLLS